VQATPAKIWRLLLIQRTVHPLLMSKAVMSTPPIAFEAFPDVDELRAEPDQDPVESFNAIRGILFGVALCVPFWAGVYWIVF
jgi:hypothetical protein